MISMTEREILNDPSASYWLKRLITSTKERDPVDCLNDLDVLRAILEARIEGARCNQRNRT